MCAQRIERKSAGVCNRLGDIYGTPQDITVFERKAEICEHKMFCRKMHSKAKQTSCKTTFLDPVNFLFSCKQTLDQGSFQFQDRRVLGSFIEQ